jgi:EAL domain-containing protein (putative c-di-GMP-specific phosphodiesterase class I)
VNTLDGNILSNKTSMTEPIDTSLVDDLRMAVDGGQLRLYYQPVVNAHGNLVGAEALMRWVHPTKGLVSPAHFIPLAEVSGLIVPMGLWALRTACCQLFEWSKIPFKAVRTIAVNVSAQQLQTPDFVEAVLRTIAATGANPRRLKIELTESVMVNDVKSSIAKMQALREAGIKFSIDDFGTGYSSLSYLRQMPLDQLKIDQSFVRDIHSDPNDAAIVRTILVLANALDLSVVAEGVETAEQEDFLIAAGCRYFQGYLYGRPMAIQDWP